MTLVLVPRGRGRWSPIRITYDPRRRSLPAPVLIKVGEDFELMGRTYRVQRIEP